MKYIRTKDRVCEFERELSTMPELIAVKGEGIGGFVRKEDIVKQADTIEELCDEFVYVNKVEGLSDKTHTIPFDMKNHQFTEPTAEEKMAYIKKHYKDDLEKIRGAIWTDKGLIYVTKPMNEKGELELL